MTPEEIADDILARPEYVMELESLRMWIADAIRKEREKYGSLIGALALIAAPKRPDGTYNRCREACAQLAEEALKAFEEKV